MDTAVDTATGKPAAASEGTGWKTEEYHGMQMHVCAEPRVPENVALSGHGVQWRFTVRITGPGPTDSQDAGATSDPDLFYSTQAIAEAMGFLRGRELIEGT